MTQPLAPAAPAADLDRGLSHRVLEPELMDDPELGASEHRGALRALSRVHLLSGTGRRLRRSLDALVRSTPRDRPIRVLDVACGGGDAVLDAARWGRNRDRAVDVVALDRSPRALEIVGERAAREGLPVSTVLGDALDRLPDGPFDLIFSSLFLHHLRNDDVRDFLEAASERTRRLHVEDLRRTRLGLVLAHLTLTLLVRSPVARVDGPRSVRAGWHPGELIDLAEAAGLPSVRVDTVWPQRLLLRWRAP